MGLMLREMHRVLKPGGAYLVISYGFPATRMGYLRSKRLEWQVEHFHIRKFHAAALWCARKHASWNGCL